MLKSACRIYFKYISRHEAKKIITNSNLIDKKGVLYKKNVFFFII